MKKKAQISLRICCLAFILVSCQGSETDTTLNGEVVTFEIPGVKGKDLNFKDYIEEVELMPLETKKEHFR